MIYTVDIVSGEHLGYTPKEVLRPGDVFVYGEESYRVVSLNHKIVRLESEPNRLLLQDCTIKVERCVD